MERFLKLGGEIYIWMSNLICQYCNGIYVYRKSDEARVCMNQNCSEYNREYLNWQRDFIEIEWEINRELFCRVCGSNMLIAQQNKNICKCTNTRCGSHEPMYFSEKYIDFKKVA